MSRQGPSRRGWILGGWLFSLLASALPALWVAAERVQRNPLGKYVDPETGEWTSYLYWTFFQWWLPIAAAVSLLALASMFLNRPDDRGPD